MRNVVAAAAAARWMTGLCSSGIPFPDQTKGVLKKMCIVWI
jgi:hypothetical protein